MTMAPNAVSFFCLLFNNLIGYSQTFPHHWIENGCIPADEYFICISLDFIKSLDAIKDHLSEIHIEINSTASSISPVYVTDSYDFGNSNFGNLRDILTCFYPDIIESVSSPSIQLSIYNSSNSAYIASNTIPNINSLNMTVYDDPLIFTQDWQNISNVFDENQLEPIPETRFSLWISQSQCIEITDSIMFLANNFYLNVDMYRIDENNQIMHNIIFRTSKLRTFSASPSFDAIFCLPAYPLNESQGLIGANITLMDSTTDCEPYELSKINSEDRGYYVSPSAYWEQSSFDEITLHFAMGNVQMNYWQSCSLSIASGELKSDQFKSYAISLLSVLLFIILLCVLSGCYTCKYYQGTYAKN